MNEWICKEIKIFSLPSLVIVLSPRHKTFCCIAYVQYIHWYTLSFHVFPHSWQNENSQLVSTSIALTLSDWLFPRRSFHTPFLKRKRLNQGGFLSELVSSSSQQFFCIHLLCPSFCQCDKVERTDQDSGLISDTSCVTLAPHLIFLSISSSTE